MIEDECEVGLMHGFQYTKSYKNHSKLELQMGAAPKKPWCFATLISSAISHAMFIQIGPGLYPSLFEWLQVQVSKKRYGEKKENSADLHYYRKGVILDPGMQQSYRI